MNVPGPYWWTFKLLLGYAYPKDAAISIPVYVALGRQPSLYVPLHPPHPRMEGFKGLLSRSPVSPDLPEESAGFSFFSSLSSGSTLWKRYGGDQV